MRSLKHFSTLCINTRPLTTRRTYLLKFLPSFSFYRSFQTSKNNNNEDDNNNDKKEDNINNKNDFIQKDKQIDLFDKFLSNDLNPTGNDVNLNGEKLFSILKESLSKSQSNSNSILSEGSQPISITTTPSLSDTPLETPLNTPLDNSSDNSSDTSKTSMLDFSSLFNTTTSISPTTETSTESTLDPILETTIIPSTEEEATATLTIDKGDPRFMREDPVISQLINIIMRHGKKATARRFLANAMIEIRKQTHNDPYLITKTAIEKASPLVGHMTYKKGSKATLIPKPLNERQRRHKGIRWILDASDKRSGKNFSIRLANEILAVINGTSTILKKREQLHKLAIANRANLPVKW